MKMPEPIIEPMTMVVESRTPSRRANLLAGSVFAIFPLC